MATRIDTTIDDELNPKNRYGITSDGTLIGKFLRGNDAQYIELFMNKWIGQFSGIENDSDLFLLVRLFTYQEYINWYEGQSHQLLDTISKRILGLRGKYDKSYRGYAQLIHKLSQDNKTEVSEVFYTPLSVRIPLSARKRNMYVVGSIGTGKSTLLKSAIYDDVLRNDSFVAVIDPKGPLAKEVSNWKEFAPGQPHHERLIYISFSEFLDLFPRFNVFDQFTDPDFAVGGLIDTFSSIFKEISDGAEFTVAMQSLLKPALYLIFYSYMNRDEEIKPMNFIDLYEMMDPGTQNAKGRFHSPEDIKGYLQKADKIMTNAFHKKFFKEKFSEALPTSKQGIEWRTAWLLHDAIFQYMTHGQSTFNLNEIIEKKQVLVVDLSKGKLNARVSSTIGKLLISSIGLTMKHREAMGKEIIDCWLTIDEFHNFVTASMLTDLAEGRSAGLHFTVAQQVVQQGMSEEFMRILMANTAVKLVLQGTLENWEIMEQQLGISRERISDTPKYYYWLKIENKPAILVNTDNELLVDDNNGMTPNERQQMLSIQRFNYYREPVPLFAPDADDVIGADSSDERSDTKVPPLEF